MDMHVHAHAFMGTLLLQIVGLVQASRLVAIYGPSGCGKTAAVQVAAETLRHSTPMCFVSTTTIAAGAIREEQLLGYQDEQEEYVPSLIIYTPMT